MVRRMSWDGLGEGTCIYIVANDLHFIFVSRWDTQTCFRVEAVVVRGVFQLVRVTPHHTALWNGVHDVTRYIAQGDTDTVTVSGGYCTTHMTHLYHDSPPPLPQPPHPS